MNKKIFPPDARNLELDIVTRHHIIEVKSGSRRKNLGQVEKQKAYAIKHNKIHIVYALNIICGAKREYNRQGFIITTSIQELINKMKENEK